MSKPTDDDTQDMDAAADPGKEKKPKARKKPEDKSGAAPGDGPAEPSVEPIGVPGLTEGRVVHYVLPDGKRRGEHRAAIVSYVWDHAAGLVNLHVLLNGDLEYPAGAHPGNNWLVQKVAMGSHMAEGTWHFIERA